MAYLNGSNATSLSVTVPSLSSSRATAIEDPSEQVIGEIDKAVEQLKYKRTFQDEDSLNGQAASVYSSAGVSQIVALVCGPEKNELDTKERQTLKELESFFKELIKVTKVSSGIKAKEGLGELFHNPEHIVFQDLLTNEPGDWAKLVLPVLLDIQRKEVCKEKSKAEIQELQLKRRELAKDTALEKKRLQEMQADRKEKLDKMHPDNIRRITIGLESYRSEGDTIETTLSKCGKVVTNSDIEELLSQFEEVKFRNEKLKDELNQISVEGALPPNTNDALVVFENRKRYYEGLLERISDLSSDQLDISSRSSLDNSAFLHRKSSN